MKLYWKSESIPKQIILEEYLFYYEWVNSPYSVEITSNLIYYQNCYIKNLESKIYAEKKLYIIDVQYIIIINDETVFQTLYFSVSLINPDTSITKGNIYTQSIYNSGNVKFTVNLVPLIPREI